MARAGGHVQQLLAALRGEVRQGSAQIIGLAEDVAVAVGRAATLELGARGILDMIEFLHAEDIAKGV
jgi:hypothetical protein